MGTEVTMKDLQSLQGYVNKKIAEVDANLSNRLSDINKRFVAAQLQIDQHVKTINQHTTVINELRDVINQHAKTLNERR